MLLLLEPITFYLALTEHFSVERDVLKVLLRGPDVSPSVRHRQNALYAGNEAGPAAFDGDL